MSAGKSGARVRAEAARVVSAVVHDGRSLDVALASAAGRIAEEDQPVLRMLCYGALRYHWRLRASLSELLQRPLKARDKLVESLLLIGLYQLSDTRVPDHAAVSMTVEAARVLRLPKFAGLINGVLRNYIRQQPAAAEAVRVPAADDEVSFNHPAWFIARLQADWPDHWQSILTANNERAPLWLRVNARHGSAAAYQSNHGVEGSLLPGAPAALRLARAVPVEKLPGFHDGLVSVQDGAAQLAAPWLLDGGGRRVLDACAAPGGKTGHLRELLADEAELTALDADAERLAAVKENLARLQLSATLTTADASRPEEWWSGEAFDRILLDAPCSASGVIRRHPDIKLLRRESDIRPLAALQRTMLQALWGVLEAGGRLLYVTCSVLSEENDEVISDFLASNPDAAEDRLLHDYNIRDLMLEKPAGFQVLPGTAGLDGFYFACLHKAGT